MPDRLRDKLLTMVGEVHPEDGVDPEIIRRRNKARTKPKDHKINALCKQIEIALSMSTPAELDLVPLSVTPGADPSHVVVIFQPIDKDVDIGAAEEKLASLEGYFRDVAAEAINRRRVPDLLFRISPKTLYE